MENNNLVLGIDTSNYTTSVALTGRQGEIIKNIQKPLRVKQGERGLRQSYALFQHVEQLPQVLAEVLDSPLRGQIAAVAASDKPRPVEGSYMPVFLAGLRFGSVAASALGVPFFRFSHQEGHLAAGSLGTALAGAERLLCWHLSGGTCELLLCEGGSISVVGGSKDISFGQLIDRVGVSMGFPFPCGKFMDRLALQGEPEGKNPLKPVPVDGLFFNVSGIETQVQRILESGREKEELSYFVFSHIADCLVSVSRAACASYGFNHVLFTGGVSASIFLRGALEKRGGSGFQAVFGEPALSTDNAVGISLLGGRQLWH